MRTSLTLGLSLALLTSASIVSAQGGANATGQPAAAGAGDNNPYTLYSAIPRVPGIKTLIDFNDYDDAVANARGHVNVRYVEPGGSIPGVADSANRANAVGYEQGMPVTGFVMDPPHSNQDVGGGDPAMDRMRNVVSVGALFADPDPSRVGDAYSRTLNPGGSAVVDYAQLPKDRFGGVVYTLSKEDVEIDNWVVELNSSAATIPARRNSYAKTVTDFNRTQEYLGVRVHFPNHRHNAHARVAPPYPIPAYDAKGFPINYSFFDPQGTNPFQGDAVPTHKAVSDARAANEDVVGNAAKASEINYAGVLHNVSDMREIVVRISGRNYRNGVAIRLRDQNMEVEEYFLGYTDFVGWRTLRWINPNYLPADEMEPFRLPLYPSEIPYIAFDSFIFYRDGTELGGDYVAYVDYVKLDYDLAVPGTQLEVSVPGFIDIDDESWWMILRDRNSARSEMMMRKFSEAIDLRRQQLGRSARHSEGLAPVEGTQGLQSLNEVRGARAGGAAAGGGN